jgi:hypothetical protein
VSEQLHQFKNSKLKKNKDDTKNKPNKTKKIPLNSNICFVLNEEKKKSSITTTSVNTEQGIQGRDQQ